METRDGIVTELYEEHGQWWTRIEVLAPAWAKEATIVLPGEETSYDFPGKGDPEHEELQSLFGPMKQKPPLEIGGTVKVRFT